jgi:hypothetical protein
VFSEFSRINSVFQCAPPNSAYHTLTEARFERGWAPRDGSPALDMITQRFPTARRRS